jgi:hypothetical protein
MEVSLNDYIDGFKKNPQFGALKDRVSPWYNSVGDCIEFQITQEAYVADRIDNFLTIYRSIDKNEPIGFQIKDVKALVEKCGAAGLEIECGTDGDELISVSAVLFAAYERNNPTIARRQGYAMATQALSGDRERDMVAVG